MNESDSRIYMIYKITESAVETFATGFLEHQGCFRVYGPAIAPDSNAPERPSFE